MTSAQAYMSHQKKWKETLIKQAQKTMTDRLAREKHLEKFRGQQEKGK